MRKKLWSRILVIAAAGIVAAGIAACSGGGASDDSSSSGTPAVALNAPASSPAMKKLIAQARAEGSVNWYFGLTGASVPKIVAAFEKQYPGITVNVTSNSGAFVQSQFTTEAQAGDVHADDLSVGYSSIFPQIYQAGYTVSMNEVISGFDKEYPQGFLEGNGITGIWTATPNGFAYNTKLVPAADRPTTWKDLENPIFKGHIVTPDPNDSITYLQIWDFLDKTLGTAGAKKVVANLQRTEATGFPTELASVASGSAWVAVMAGQATVAPLVAGGAPLAYVVPAQVTGSAYANAVAKNAPHPAAARLFAYWLYSAAGQKAVSAITTGGGPLVPNSLPSDFVLPNFNAAADTGKINSLLGISS
jgi:iron(III) transport system substrate-binding protein